MCALSSTSPIRYNARPVLRIAESVFSITAVLSVIIITFWILSLICVLATTAAKSASSTTVISVLARHAHPTAEVVSAWLMSALLALLHHQTRPISSTVAAF